TRMRRNDESLLVLAGARAPRQQADPATLLDVVKAAQSEVEQYTRIDTEGIEADIHIVGAATDDLSHLLAELLENATQFSPPNTQVMVRARRVTDGVVLQVDDHGIGVLAQELIDLNRRLHQTTSGEVAADRRLGLFVVGRLAARHGVQTTLHQLPDGTRAEVRLPGGLLLAAELIPVQEEPRHPGAVPGRPLVDRPLRPSRMQYWAGGGDHSPPPPPRFEDAEGPGAAGGAGLADQPRHGAGPPRVPGQLLFPGNLRVPGQPTPRPSGLDRPHEVRRYLPLLRPGVEPGRAPEPRPVAAEPDPAVEPGDAAGTGSAVEPGLPVVP